MSEPPLIEVLKGRFPSEIINPYGEVLVVPSRLFQPGWEAELKRQGFKVYTSSFNGEACFFVKQAAGKNEASSAATPDEARGQEKERELRILPIELVVSSEAPMREVFEDINSLAATIQRHGLIHPILVRKDVSRGYVVMVGERRLRACQHAGLSHVPCLVVSADLTEDQVLEMRLIENLHRKDLKPFEKVCVFQTLRDRFRLTQRQIGEKVGLSASVVNDYLSIGELPLDVRRQIETGSVSKKALTVQKAKLLAKSDLPPEKARQLADAVKKKGYTTRQLAKKIAGEEPAKIKRTLTGRKYWRELTRSLKEFANYWPKYSSLKEWETVDSYHLELHVSMPKDLQEGKDV